MSIIEKAIDRLIDEDVPTSRREPPEKATAHAAADTVATEAQSGSSGTQWRSASPSGTDARPVIAGETTGQAAATVGAAERQPASPDDPPEVQPPVQPGAQPAGLELYQLGLEGIISPETERSRTAEEFRIIKRPLLQRAFAEGKLAGEHPNVIVVTSSVAGEGKSFTALNLAISIAMELDRTVLLVDADLANPGLSRRLKLEDRPGLLERLLDDQADLKGLLLRTDVPKLTLLPAGRRHRRSTELLASNTMKGLLDELATRYPDRVVLFDSPPLLATTEASVLANQAGQICMVVESGRTPQFLVKEAVSMLQHPDRVSLVLNKTKRELWSTQGGYYYGYKYGYGYGYGYGQDRAKT